MTAENTTLVANASASTTATPVKVDYIRTVKDVVSDKLREANPTIFNLVADELAQLGVIKRKDALKKALIELLPNLGGEIAKLKSTDTGLFDADGKKIQKATWTAEELKNIKEATEKFEKLSAAVANAIENNSWDKLLEIAGK